MTSAYLSVLFRSRIRGLLCSSSVRFSDVDANPRIEHLEESLDDNALQELHVLRRRGERRKLFTGCLEEVLQVLLAQMQEPQPRLVCHGGMGAEYDFDISRIGVDAVNTYIFCATSAPLRFFSY